MTTQQPEPDPIAWATLGEDGGVSMLFPAREEAASYCDDGEQPTPLYTAPPAREPVADAARVIEWATSTPRKAAVHAFTDGPERQAAYWIEWAERRVVNPGLTTTAREPVAILHRHPAVGVPLKRRAAVRRARAAATAPASSPGPSGLGGSTASKTGGRGGP